MNQKIKENTDEIFEFIAEHSSCLDGDLSIKILEGICQNPTILEGVLTNLEDKHLLKIEDSNVSLTPEGQEYSKHKFGLNTFVC